MTVNNIVVNVVHTWGNNRERVVRLASVVHGWSIVCCSINVYFLFE